jgi:hypothetical protein
VTIHDSVTARAQAGVMDDRNDPDPEVLEDTLELLSDPVAVRAIAKARSEVARGKVADAEELRRKYLRR